MRQFNIKKGLRQGCLLSPLLFNLIVEAFNVVMHKSISLDSFKGISVENYDLMISRLQYADDTHIFCESALEQLLNVKRVLCCFQVMSGLKINFQKSKLFGIGIEHLTLVS